MDNTYTNVVLTIQRKERIAHVILRSDDYAQSVRNGKFRWGSGAMWAVVKVETAERNEEPR